MDSPIIWKPYPWEAFSEGLHIDQNAFDTENDEHSCVQGMLPLYDVTHETGGLEVVPQSHLHHAKEAWKLRYPDFKYKGNFCRLRKDDPYQGQGMLLEAKAGDFILWSSGTVHGGRVSTMSNSSNQLIRLSQTVTMTPRSWATESILQKRNAYFNMGIGCNHSPHKPDRTTSCEENYVPIELTNLQRQLL